MIGTSSDSLGQYRARLESNLSASWSEKPGSDFNNVMIEIQKVMVLMHHELAQIFRQNANLEERIRKNSVGNLVNEHQDWKRWAPDVGVGLLLMVASVGSGGATIAGKQTLRTVFDVTKGVADGAGYGSKAYGEYSNGAKQEFQSQIEAARKKNEESTNQDSHGKSRCSDVSRKIDEYIASMHRSFSQTAGAA